MRLHVRTIRNAIKEIALIENKSINEKIALATAAIMGSLLGTPDASKVKKDDVVQQSEPRTYDKNEIRQIIKKAAKKHGVEEALIAAIVKTESNYKKKQVSNVGASGLMQLMPKTAEAMGVTNVFDPEQNIMGGTKYIKKLLQMFDNDIELALAAYNAGPGNVKKYGGVPPFKETIAYVAKVLSYYDTNQ